MNLSVAKNRINDVLMRNSIDSTQADFLATHVPFKKITVNNVFNSTESTSLFSEEEFYNQHFCNADLYDAHQLIVVEGSAGSGKSHFIRWLNAKLTWNGSESDVVILIRRDDNTLKGTIQQLLDVDAIKNIKNKEMYERLVRANKAISEVKFKNQIYHQYLVEIQSAIQGASDDFPELSHSTKKMLYALLNNDRFIERLCSTTGPIERIFHKIVKQEGVSSDENAQFEASDFELDTDFGTALLSDKADNKAVKMVNKLIPDEEGNSLANTVANYLNSLTDEVIQSCTGIEPGDFIQIFKEIRKELKSQGKNLILLIEDITSTIGINKALLEALTIGHTGINNDNELCRLISVVGTTSEYYSNFRDNYKGRITTNVKIEDESIGGNLNDLYEFFAKYLNAISISTEDIGAWYLDGAIPESMPVYVDTEHPKWEKLELNGRKLELYPFTKKAIANFYNSMGLQKTPRSILIGILEPALEEVLYRKEKYLTFMNGKKLTLIDSVDLRIRNVVSNLDVDQKIKEDLSIRSRTLVALYADNKNASRSIYGVDRAIWEEFGLGIVADKLGTETSHLPSSELGTDQISVPRPKMNQKYLSFIENLKNWYYEKKIFNNSREIRGTLSEIVFASIDWQKNNVPLKAKKLFEESTRDLFGFERQDRALDKALIVLKANEETYQVLLTVGKYLLLGNKSWNFDDVGTSIYYLTTWIESNKKKICDAILEETSKPAPYFIQCAIANDYYYRLLGGADFSEQSSLTVDSFMSNYEQYLPQKYHGEQWQGLQAFLLNDENAKKNSEILIEYYSLTQGVDIGSVKLMNYTDFASTFLSLKRNRFTPRNKADVSYNSSKKNEIVKLYCDIEKRLVKVVEEEKLFIDSTLKYLYSIFEFDMDNEDIDASDLRDLIKEAKEFYIDAEKYSFNINNNSNKMDDLYAQNENIAKAIKLSKKILKTDDVYSSLSLLSLNPLSNLTPLVIELNKLEKDLIEATNLVSYEEENQKRNGSWFDNRDTRFDEKRDEFYSLIKEVK